MKTSEDFSVKCGNEQENYIRYHSNVIVLIMIEEFSFERFLLVFKKMVPKYLRRIASMLSM